MDLNKNVVMDVFFVAMQYGYAKNAEKGVIADLPGSRMIEFGLGDFRVVDIYFVEGRHSFGQTIIWYENGPIWAMSYQGEYPKQSIPFLKRALLEAYSHHDFVGGRGPRFFTEDGEVYVNKVEPPDDWRHFRGREEIFDRNGLSVGWHEYQGLSLAE